MRGRLRWALKKGGSRHAKMEGRDSTEGGRVSKLRTPGKTGALRRTREAHVVPPGIGKAEESGRPRVGVGRSVKGLSVGLRGSALLCGCRVTMEALEKSIWQFVGRSRMRSPIRQPRRKSREGVTSAGELEWRGGADPATSCGGNLRSFAW